MGRPKALLELQQGCRMIERIAAALGEVCERIVIVGPATPGACSGLQHVPDRRVQAGPLGGVEALLASDLDAEYLVTPCDLPFVSADVLRLLAQSSDSKMSILRVEGEAKPRPLPARISAEALDVARKLLDSDRRAVWQLAEAIHAEVIPCPMNCAEALRDINTPAEYDEALRRLRPGRSPRDQCRSR
jgi:molybdopterin-guanine dinucleotide biosynthesis protein A